MQANSEVGPPHDRRISGERLQGIIHLCEAISGRGVGRAVSSYAEGCFPSEEDVLQAMHVSGTKLDDERSMVVTAGIGGVEGSPNPCLIIDADTFVTRHCQASMRSILPMFGSLDTPVSNYFRWAIRPGLHDALVPNA